MRTNLRNIVHALSGATARCWILSCLAWLALELKGFPAPHVDDLFFTGTGITLAQGLGLQNPWIESWLQHFGTTLFYAQPPTHPFALSVWIRLWGVSTHSLLAFQCLAGFACCGASAHLLLRFGCRTWAIAVGAIVTSIFVLTHGLRPDAWSLALTLIAALAWLHDSRIAWIAGCFAAALAPSFHPFAVVLVLPSAMLALGTRLVRHGPKSAAFDLIAAIAVLMVTLGFVAWLIDFAVPEFWRVFHSHATMRTPMPGTRWATLQHTFTVGFEPAIKLPGALAFAAVAVAATLAGNRRRVAAGVFLVAAGFALGAYFYAGSMPSWIWPLAGGVTLGLWSTVKPVRGHQLSSALIGLVVLWNHIPWFVSTAIARPVPAHEYRALLARSQQFNPSRLLVDEVAARYVFDYRLPTGARDWLVNRSTVHGMISSLAAKPTGEVWLVNERKLEHLVADSGVVPARAHLAGLTLQSWILYPHRLRLIE